MWNAEDYVGGLLGFDPDLARAAEGIAAAGMKDISIAPGYGRLLTVLASLSGAKEALEIGALGGISGICIARGLPEGGRLTSLELQQDYAGLAHEHLKAAGLGERIEYRVGDAKATLAELEAEGRRFGFFFIDADKEGYPIYLDYALRLAEPGAVITADNTLLRGRVGDPAKQGPSVTAMRAFNERILNDPRLTGTILPAYDGLAVAIVKR